MLTQKLRPQGYVAPKLKSSSQSFRQKVYGRHRELVDQYELSISEMKMDIFPVTYKVLSITNNTFYHNLLIINY